MKTKTTITGDKELAAKLRKLGGGVARKVVSRVIYQKAETISGMAKEHVPVDLGALKGSIHATEPEYKGGGLIESSVVAGGPSAPYAEAVHEHLSEHSPPSWVKAEESGNPVKFSGGGPKYIERPYLEVKPTIAPAIHKALRAELYKKG